MKLHQQPLIETTAEATADAAHSPEQPGKSFDVYSGGPAVRISKTVFPYIRVPHIYIYIFICIFEGSHI